MWLEKKEAYLFRSGRDGLYSEGDGQSHDDSSFWSTSLQGSALAIPRRRRQGQVSCISLPCRDADPLQARLLIVSLMQTNDCFVKTAVHPYRIQTS